LRITLGILPGLFWALPWLCPFLRGIHGITTRNKTRGGHDEPPSFCPDVAGYCLSDRRRALGGAN
jgi:hypothetical protein